MASQCGAVSIKFFQWCSSVGWMCQSFSSGIPVWDCFNYVFPVLFQCTLQAFSGSPSGIPVYTGLTSGIPGYFSVHWTSQCTLAQGKGIIIYWFIIPCKKSINVNTVVTKWLWVNSSATLVSLFKNLMTHLRAHEEFATLAHILFDISYES